MYEKLQATEEGEAREESEMLAREHSALSLHFVIGGTFKIAVKALNKKGLRRLTGPKISEQGCLR